MTQSKRFLSSTFTQVLMTTSLRCPSPTAVIFLLFSNFFFQSRRILRQGRCRRTCEGRGGERQPEHAKTFMGVFSEEGKCKLRMCTWKWESVCACFGNVRNCVFEGGHQRKVRSMRDPAGGSKLWEDGDARGAALSNQPPSHSGIFTSYIYCRYVHPHLSSDWALRLSDADTAQSNTHTHTLYGLHNRASWNFFFLPHKHSMYQWDYEW